MTQQHNHARYFNTVMSIVNEKWAARVLTMNRNGKGPDLYDKSKVVEVKFTLLSKNYHRSWTVLEDQMSYNNEHDAYWGLGTYALDIPFSQLTATNLGRLEKHVEQRDLYVVKWDWMSQFLPSKTSGKTRKSEWHITLRYPKMRLLPAVVAAYRVHKGRVHITKGVPEEKFIIEGKKIS